jgi:acyl-CoA thioesterase-1
MGKLMLRGFVCALAICFVVGAAKGQTRSDLPPVTAAATTPKAFGATTVAKTIVFLGDSLTAGYGLPVDQSYPSLIAEKIRAAHLPYEVVNAGLSGDTSAGGLRRIDWLLQNKIDLLVVALGANDGLRGLSPKMLEANLQAIIDKTKAKNPAAQIVVAGMQMPPNLGADYAENFQRVFAEVAQKNNAVFIPFLLADVGGHRDLNQSDSIHPTVAGQKIIAETVWQTLKPILQKP